MGPCGWAVLFQKEHAKSRVSFFMLHVNPEVEKLSIILLREPGPSGCLYSACHDDNQLKLRNCNQAPSKCFLL